MFHNSWHNFKGVLNYVMKKIALFLMIITAFSANANTLNQSPNWSGFYLGANAGYWDSQTNHVKSHGSILYINPTYGIGASNIANALAQLATQSSSLNSDGLIAGIQAGYNYELSREILLGLHIDFDGLTNSQNTTTLHNTVNLVDYDENYVGSLAIKEKINYLSTLRARFGYLYCPTFLVYATGGFAYGNVKLDTTWTVQESLGPAVFPTIRTQHNVNNTLTGWTAGAGIEWFFKPNWSSMLEYSYYSLNNLHAPVTLAQTNNSISPPALWGSATANTTLSLSTWNIRVGLNYHFL